MRFIIKIDDDLVKEIVEKDFEDVRDFTDYVEEGIRNLFGDDADSIVRIITER